MGLPFSRILTLIRRKKGEYVDGFWRDSNIINRFQMQASVQPASQEDLLTLPEGNRLTSTLKLYTTIDMLVDDEKRQIESDRVLIDGRTYKVVGDMNYDQTLGVPFSILHKKYLVQLENEKTVVDETRV